jgi:sulfonate transport system substrate-binding protein
MATTRRQAMMATAALLAARGAGASAAKPAPLSPPVKLTLGANTVPHVSPFQYIADEARPLGVNVEVVKFERYADTRTALASGSIDMGSIGPADVPIALSQGLKTIVALMGVGISPKNPIVAKGFSPTKWEDFAGKRVGVAPGSAVWFQFAATLIEAGFPYSKIQPINMQGAGTVMVQSLQRNDIDAFIGWEPFESMAVNQGVGVRAEALDYSKSKAVGAELGLVGVNRNFLTTQREAVKRFVWAYLAIQDRLMASKEALATAIAAYTGLPTELARSVAASMTLGQFLTLDQMKRQAATFAQLGVLTKDVSGELGDYFAGDLVAEIQNG